MRRPEDDQIEQAGRGVDPGEAIMQLLAQVPPEMGDQELPQRIDALGDPAARVVRRHLMGRRISPELKPLLERPEAQAVLALHDRQASCPKPECDGQREGAVWRGRWLWDECPECRRQARTDRWCEWLAKVESAWRSEALAQIGRTHWPADVGLMPEVRRLFDADHPAWAVYLHGTTGTGKTQQGAEVIREALSERLSQYGLDAPERFDGQVRPYPPLVFAGEAEMLASLRPGRRDPVDLEHYAEAELLVLDDLGISKGSPWAYEQINAVIQHRYEQHLATVFTSNCDLPGLREGGFYDARLTSRIFEMCGGWEAQKAGTLAVVELTTNHRMPAEGGEVLW